MSEDRFFTEDSSTFPSVRIAETTDDALGGDDGPLNIAPRQLTQRTDYLNEQLQALSEELSNVDAYTRAQTDQEIENAVGDRLTQSQADALYIKKLEYVKQNYIVNSSLHPECWQNGDPCSVLPYSNFLAAGYGPDQYIVHGSGGGNPVQMRRITREYENQKINLCQFYSDTTDNTNIIFGNVFETDNLSSGGVKNFSLLFENPSYATAFTPRVAIYELNGARTIVRTIVPVTDMTSVPAAAGLHRVNLVIDLGNAINFSDGNAVFVSVSIPARDFVSLPLAWGGFQITDGEELRPLIVEDKTIALHRSQRFYQNGQISWYGYNTGGNFMYSTYLLPVEMRTTPALSLSGGVGIVGNGGSTTGTTDTKSFTKYVSPTGSNEHRVQYQQYKLDARF